MCFEETPLRPVQILRSYRRPIRATIGLISLKMPRRLQVLLASTFIDRTVVRCLIKTWSVNAR